MSESILRKNIFELLKELGVPSHICGHKYLFDAIEKVYTKPKRITAMKLYEMIADAHQTTSMRVERAMRHAIEVSVLRGNIEKITVVFSYSINNKTGKPTVQEFIYGCVNYIRYELCGEVADYPNTVFEKTSV